jgi:hypothetical protein
MFSPELETLDQLLGGDLRLEVISKLYPSREAFARGVLGLLAGGDLVVVTREGVEVPKWQWQGVLSGAGCEGLSLRITSQGARRIG